LGGPETVIFDAVIVGRTDSAHQVLAAYIEKNRLRTILDKFKVHGIDPVCITSLELRNALEGFSLSKLVPSLSIADDKRIALAIEEIKKPTVNFRRDEFSYTRDVERTTKSLKVTAVLCTLIILVMGADVLYRILSSKQEIVFLRSEIRKSYRELFPEEKNVMNELHQLKAHVRELQGREGIFVGIKPLNVFSELARIDREGARFHEMSIEKEKLFFRGEAGSLSAVQQLRDKMRAYFDEVDISDSKASAQGKALFTITAKERRS
jgi:type II secretory pathway component PulL